MPSARNAEPLVTAVMVSCRQRETARALTIPQLEAAGVHVEVFLDDCRPPVKSPPGNNGVGLRAIRHAMTLGGPVLLVEDDIDLAPDFRAYLAAALKSRAAVYFYLNDRPDRLLTILGAELAQGIKHRLALPRRIATARTYTGLFGTQCVLLPEAVLSRVEACLERYGDALDGNVARALAELRYPTGVAVPHPVQHRHDRTARTPDEKTKTSQSFALERVGEGVSVDADLRDAQSRQPRRQ